MPFPFPFTFSLTVPGLANPFSASPLYPYQQSLRTQNEAGTSTMKTRRRSNLDEHGNEDELNLSKHHPKSRRASPSPVELGSSRKRGWEPAFAGEPSLAPTFVTVSNGYLDTSAKLGKQNGLNAHEQAVEELQHPPAKRRRTLAGSIVSTAVNAALVGTAVGLTVYRLWRDRGIGKHMEQQITGEDSPSPPPPPYTPSSPDVNVIPPTPRTTRKSRRTHDAHSTRRRPARKVVHNISSLGASTSTPQSALFPPVQPAFDFSPPSQSSPSTSSQRNQNRQTHSPAFGSGASSDQIEGIDSRDGRDLDVDDQMDQMDSLGSKLSLLIEQGKRALGREVVVMSEVEEDAVDDGSGAWIEEDEEGEFGRKDRAHRGRLSRSGSTSKRRTAGSVSASSTTGSLGRRAGVGMNMNINPPPYGMGTDMSLSSSLPSTPPASLPSCETSWESPELRETMERARAIVKERKSMIFRTDTGSL
ncbi:hypothetical protein F5890DRAFT_1519348 [Lentinula detonsa]|uniref:Uncharacterized protein n=1 Tax=Lentinula detonsa TaxID=2804962 RepID=A0AA38URS2_9AGAR|nr:hypothetical protein F5890DRAFT_1519348 [Lentinula detonsa]